MGTKVMPGSWEIPDPSIEQVVVECLPILAGVAARLTRSPHEAADLVQETCCRAIEKARYLRDRSNPVGWLCRILQNICCDRQRRLRREVPFNDLVVSAAEEGPVTAWRWISDEEYARALASLSPIHHLTYTRHVVEGHSYADIAVELGISPRTVGVRLMRARAKMRLFLEGRLNARDRRAACKSVPGGGQTAGGHGTWSPHRDSPPVARRRAAPY